MREDKRDLIAAVPITGAGNHNSSGLNAAGI